MLWNFEDRGNRHARGRAKSVVFTPERGEMSVQGWMVDTIGDCAERAKGAKALEGLGLMNVLLFTLTCGQKMFGDLCKTNPGLHLGCTLVGSQQLAHVMARATGVHAPRWKREVSWISEHCEVVVGSTCVRISARRYLDIPHHDLQDPTAPDLDRSTKLIIMKMSECRRLLGSVLGVPVLAPSDTIDDDLVCVLRHRPVPVALRRARDQYVSVGECCHYLCMNKYHQVDVESSTKNPYRTHRVPEIRHGTMGFLPQSEHLPDAEGLGETRKVLQLDKICWEVLAEERKPETLFSIR